jgi:hypothetical protein
MARSAYDPAYKTALNRLAGNLESRGDGLDHRDWFTGDAFMAAHFTPPLASLFSLRQSVVQR